MFAARYYAPRYYAPRYFPKVGATPTPATARSNQMGIYIGIRMAFALFLIGKELL